MENFDPFVTEILNNKTSDKTYIELFPLCNVAISLQALFITKTISLLRKPFYPSYDFKIGMIGCGTVGSLLLRTLLDFSGIKPHKFVVSTRRPETLSHFQKEGVFVCYDNQKVIEECDLIFVTVLPYQLTGMSSLLHSPPIPRDEFSNDPNNTPLYDYFAPEESFSQFITDNESSANVEANLKSSFDNDTSKTEEIPQLSSSPFSKDQTRDRSGSFIGGALSLPFSQLHSSQALRLSSSISSQNSSYSSQQAYHAGANVQRSAHPLTSSFSRGKGPGRISSPSVTRPQSPPLPKKNSGIIPSSPLPQSFSQTPKLEEAVEEEVHSLTYAQPLSAPLPFDSSFIDPSDLPPPSAAAASVILGAGRLSRKTSSGFNEEEELPPFKRIERRGLGTEQPYGFDLGSTLPPSQSSVPPPLFVFSSSSEKAKKMTALPSVVSTADSANRQNIIPPASSSTTSSAASSSVSSPIISPPDSFTARPSFSSGLPPLLTQGGTKLGTVGKLSAAVEPHFKDFGGLSYFDLVDSGMAGEDAQRSEAGTPVERRRDRDRSSKGEAMLGAASGLKGQAQTRRSVSPFNTTRNTSANLTSSLSRSQSPPVFGERYNSGSHLNGQGTQSPHPSQQYIPIPSFGSPSSTSPQRSSISSSFVHTPSFPTTTFTSSSSSSSSSSSNSDPSISPTHIPSWLQKKKPSLRQRSPHPFTLHMSFESLPIEEAISEKAPLIISTQLKDDLKENDEMTASVDAKRKQSSNDSEKKSINQNDQTIEAPLQKEDVAPERELLTSEKSRLRMQRQRQQKDSQSSAESSIGYEPSTITKGELQPSAIEGQNADMQKSDGKQNLSRFPTEIPVLQTNSDKRSTLAEGEFEDRIVREVMSNGRKREERASGEGGLESKYDSSWSDRTEQPLRFQGSFERMTARKPKEKEIGDEWLIAERKRRKQLRIWERERAKEEKEQELAKLKQQLLSPAEVVGMKSSISESSLQATSNGPVILPANGSSSTAKSVKKRSSINNTAPTDEWGNLLSERKISAPQLPSRKRRKKHLPVVCCTCAGMTLKRLALLFRNVTPFVCQTKVNTLNFARVLSNPFVVLPQRIDDPALLRLTLPPEDSKQDESMSFFASLLHLSQVLIWHLLTMRLNSTVPPLPPADIKTQWMKLRHLIEVRLCGSSKIEPESNLSSFIHQRMATKVVSEPVLIRPSQHLLDTFQKHFITVLKFSLSS
ncbi:oxidoreductase [Monocercomonoides exilis]|uniref:oxidoreductase n=1 Tax=Monocercomonoides exilis TaxID=2049356 RepID=UPI00355A49B4|nr:oxidoreductase [Monocercomonoides exilis]|eukprot:MONOS_1321.1-p1 / transcript=MONOS_1321.1 / gene=MONOS_1321 / organism=Monocercomonoides_exilis_PA203 / gene_product=putative oxidoreductase / transcript_product=putative oxidoreductase / location=Mono_scaffold00022:210699-214808(+) / protein_length=1214 / sequence_SO=supercontig / SO=protein_coding / is_pseudo=false